MLRSIIPLHLLIGLLIAPGNVRSQTLVDSIPLPGLNVGFWGVHVNPDTVFLGADGPGSIYYADHNGSILGILSYSFTYCHGLVRRPSSYLIAKDFTTNGALLQEISLNGALLNTWTFPPVIGGNSSGIGDLCADGNAVWYTMYYPDFNIYPYAYAYKWVPGSPAPVDTVPLHGEQPYGIALKGDTLFYVTDNLNGDQERIYAYDLTNEQDIGWVDLPDTPIDNDMSPRGMFYDGSKLYLVANRQGGNAFAYQTVYIYNFDVTTGLMVSAERDLLNSYPNPAQDRFTLDLPFVATKSGWLVEVFDPNGRTVATRDSAQGRIVLETENWAPGIYAVRGSNNGRTMTGNVVIVR